MDHIPGDPSGEIRIDKEGGWFFNGAPIRNKNILDLFNASIEHDGCGGYCLHIGQEINPLVVEDTPFVVTHIEPELSGETLSCFQIRLSDGSREELWLESLFISPENIPYCRVKKGSFPARFLRTPYYELASHIRQEEDRFYIPVAGSKRFIEYRDRKSLRP